MLSQATQPGPSASLVAHTVKQFGTSQQLLKDLGGLTSRVNAAFQCAAPIIYGHYESATQKAKEMILASQCASPFYNSVFCGMCVVRNRRTPRHKDRKCHECGFDAIYNTGPYTGGRMYLPELGLLIDNDPGTFILVKGTVLLHEIGPWEGERTTVVYFTHRVVFEYVGEADFGTD